MRLNFFMPFRKKNKKKTHKKTTKKKRVKQSKEQTCKPNIPHVTGSALSLSVSLPDIVSDLVPVSPSATGARVPARCRTAPGGLLHSMSQY